MYVILTLYIAMTHWSKEALWKVITVVFFTGRDDSLINILHFPHCIIEVHSIIPYVATYVYVCSYVHDVKLSGKTLEPLLSGMSIK